MTTAAGSAAWVVAAVVAQGLVSRFAGPRLPLDLVLVVVVALALRRGRVTGLLAGSFAGLAQDALAGSVLGIGGLAKSVVGFLTGVAGTQFIVTQHLPRLLVFALATLVHAALFTGMSVLLDLQRFELRVVDLAYRSLVNGLAGVMLMGVVDVLPGARERWRARRGALRRTRFR
ncbi:MAG: rod shape-determining protein MreD [Acidobacteriota bacterium]